MSDDPQSIREMAEKDAEEAAEELFPIGALEGDETTLGSLVKPGQTNEVTVSMMTAEVPSPRGGLLSPDRDHLLLVTTEHAGYTEIPKREGDRVNGKTVVGWKTRQNLRPVYVERVNGEAGAIEAAFTDLLRANEQDAMALLDRMRARAETALGVTTS
jgi:hypothetical protein